MVTQETAQSIVDVCKEIEECEQALAILKGEEECQEPCLFVRQSDVDDGICISVSRGYASEIIEKILGLLEAKYSSLNDAALNETK